MGFGLGGGMYRGGAGGGMGLGMGMGRGALARSDLALDEEDFGKAFDARVYGRLWGYCRAFRSRLWISIVLMVVYTGANVIQPYLLKVAIDGFILARDGRGLTIMVGVFMA